MSVPSLVALQDAVHAALAGSAETQALIGNPVRLYDHVPEDAAFPYVELGEVNARRFDSQSRSGLDCTLTLNVWSRYRGRREVKQILDATYGALHDGALSIAGNAHVLTSFQSAETRRDADGLTYHGVARYRVIVQSV
jgi:hypothetical protein